MRYLSVCSGIEAATVAWHPLGWEPVAFSEIEPFPCAVLAHHYPDVPNLGDMTKIHESEVFRGAAIDLLCGGTPCQAFSVAGLRKGLADPRGNLALVFLGLADAARPRWVVWENVPGVLSSNGGRDFGAFLGGLAELGYGWAYRVLDAQYFGVAQRRRRVFVVGHVGGWQRAAAVLFERESLSGNPAPRREARKDVAPTLSSRTSAGGGLGTDFDLDGGLIAHTLRGEGFDASEDGTGRGTPIIPVDLQNLRLGREDLAGTLLAEAEPSRGGGQAVLGFRHRASSHDNAPTLEELAPSLRAADDDGQGVLEPTGVRRLTPRECERLQGFPDDYTLIPHRGKPAADGPRYKALGNSMAVPVMRWIGERIAAADALPPA